jgi:hypothetical protein
MGGFWSDPADEIEQTVKKLGGLFPGCGNYHLEVDGSLINQYRPELRRVMLAVSNFCMATRPICHQADDNQDAWTRAIETAARGTSCASANVYAGLVAAWATLPQSAAVGDAPTAARRRCADEASAFANFLTECDSSGLLSTRPTPWPFGSPRIYAIAIKHAADLDRRCPATEQSDSATSWWLVDTKHGYRPPGVKMDLTEPAAELAAERAAAERAARLEAAAEVKRLKNAARDALCTPNEALAYAAYTEAQSKYDDMPRGV